VWRRSIITLAIVGGSLAGAAIALKSDRVAENVKAYLSRLAAERFATRLTIAELEIELVPPGLAVAQVAAFRLDDGRPLLSLVRGRVSLRPWPSAAGALVIQRLELDGLRGTLDLRRPDASPEAPSATSRLAIDVEDLAVWNTDLTLITDEATVSLARADVTMRPTLSGRDLQLTFAELQVVRGATTLRAEASLRGSLAGSIDRPEKLSIDRGVVALRRMMLEAEGSLTLAGQPGADLDLRGRAPLAGLLALAGLEDDARGDLEVDLVVRGPFADLTAKGSLSARNLFAFGRDFGQMEVEGEWAGERVQLDSFRVDHRQAGTVTGSATVSLAEHLPLTFAARLHRASLPQILDLAGVPDTWVPLKLSADVKGSGTLAPFQLQLDLGGTVEGFAVLDRSYRAPDPFVVMSIPQTDIEGGVEITTAAVNIHGITLRRGDSELGVNGSLHFDVGRGLELRATGQSMRMEDVGPIADIPFEGHGALAATIEGPYDDPGISGTATLDDFEVLGLYVGDTNATVVFADGTLSLPRAEVRRGLGTLLAEGAFELGETPPRVRATAEVQGVDIAEILFTLGVPMTLADRFHASTRGQVRLAGPLALPTGSFALTAPSLVIDGVSLGQLDLHGGFGDETAPVWSEATLTPAEGRLQTRVAWRADETLELSAEAAAMPLALVRPFTGDLPVDGSVSGTTRLTGPPAQLSGEVRLTVARLTVTEVRLETTELEAELAAGTMTLTGQTLDGDAEVSAKLTLGEHLPFTATASLKSLSLSRLVDLPGGLDVEATGTLFAQGDLTRPETLMADLHLDAADTDWAGFSLSAARPVRLQYANGIVQIDDLNLTGGGAQLSAAGSVGPEGRLDVQVKGAADLTPGIGGAALDWLRGRVELAATAKGSVTAPQVSGRANLAGAALRLGDTGDVIDNIAVRAAFAGRTLNVEGGTATWGGGRANLAGRVLLPGSEGSDLDLRLRLESVTLRPAADTVATVTGDLNLVGPFDDLLLRGRLKLDSLQYTANLDLDRLVPKRNAPPLRVSGLDAEHAIRLGVAVTADNNVILSNNVVEAEARVDLFVTGTSERVGLLGSVVPLWGRARYRDNVFVVERGTIDFSEEFRIFTQFDLRATTDACDMKVAVDVHGNSDRYDVVPRGQDKNGIVDPQDVLSCLQFGLRMSDLEEQMRVAETPGEEKSPLANPVLASGLDTLWTVSGMDAKVRRLLPIKLDEVRLESGWSTHFRRSTTRVLIGKDLAQNLRFEYARSLDELNDQTLALEYQLSEVAAFQGSWLSASDVSVGNLGLDLRLRWEFR
jgi:translocation and assembly module TamB